MEYVEIKREVCLKLLRDYYANQNRTITPHYESYSINDLKKCLYLFKIPYTENNISVDNIKKKDESTRNKPKAS
jgi:hypothetical protein